MSILRLAAMIAPSLLLVACSSLPDPGAEGCPGGVRPSIDECAQGTSWAECGGTAGDPRFACSEGLCLWFDHACVAEGFVVSSCPGDDLCCLDDFPYASDWTTSSSAEMGLSSFLHEWGVSPWDRSRERTVDVTIATPASATLAITCEGVVDAARGPCATENVPGQRIWRDDVLITIARSPSIAILFWELSIEVTRDGDESLHARVCRVHTTDTTMSQCGVRPEPECALSGTLELDAFPEDATAAETARMHLTATFADGATIDATL